MPEIQKAQHAPCLFPVIADELHCGGLSLDALAAKVGGTPFYAYDRALIDQRIGELRGALPAEISVHYAIKANPLPALVDHLAKQLDGFDVASAGEMRIALASGMNPAHISFAGPGKRDDELRAAIEAGITLNVESANELERIVGIGSTLGIRPQVALRINPDFELKSSGMKMGGGAKPFGIDAEQIPAVLRLIQQLDLRFRGFHIFSGSQNLHAERIIEAQNATFELAYRLASDDGPMLETLNIGGGFGIPYFPGEQRLDISPIAANLAEQLPRCRERLGDVEVVIELGRYLVGEAGIYCCRVLDRKVSRGQVFLVVDGGMHHHLAASGNLGQVIRKNYPVVNAGRVAGEPRETVSVTGPLCTPLDLLADRMELGKAEIGDLIVVLQSGAYGLSASPQAFLGHPAPKEILL